MADGTKSFSDLLSEAPLAATEDTVTLVGALARSNQPGKFVLALSQGNSVTLDIDAVKGYQVVGGGVGQLLVQVDVDRAQVPDSVQEAAQPNREILSGIYDYKQPAADYKSPILDYKHPTLDKYPWEEPVRTHPETDLAPFALATQQQAPPSALSAMQAGATNALRSIPTLDVNTGYRDYHKNPILDATGRPPYLD
jgi:hypothetical protein